MKKILLIIVLLVIGLGVYLFMYPEKRADFLGGMQSNENLPPALPE